MSTISDALKKKRDEDDEPSAETAEPRLVRVEVPRDHSARNTLLVAVLGIVVAAGAVVGGYALLGKMGAFDRPPATAPPATGTRETPAVGETTQPPRGEVAPVEPETDPAAGLKLQAIFPDPIDPRVVINNRTLKLGGTVEGFRLVAVGEDRVVLERAGKRYELSMQ